MARVKYEFEKRINDNKINHPKCDHPHLLDLESRTTLSKFVDNAHIIYLTNQAIKLEKKYISD